MPDSNANFEYVDALATGPLKGRGAGLNPGNRYESVRLHVLGEFLDEQLRSHCTPCDDDCATVEDAMVSPVSKAPPHPGPLPQSGERGAIAAQGPAQVPTIVYEDDSRTIINPVNSPDLSMRWTINPYRGCGHGCIYCYARPDHERLGFSCGLDFETRIVAKVNAAALLRKELAHPKWQPEWISMCGVTDCYQPVEAMMKLSRACLEVFAEFRQPVGIVTKNRMVMRDLDLLKELAKHNAVHVAISVTTLDNALAAKMEPRASSPSDRLRTIRELTDAGIPTMAMVAPIIPGLNDKELPAILEAVAEAGAITAGYVLLRLPHQIKALFLDWLARHFPQRAAHIESLIRQTHDGELYDSRFGERRRGSGAVAEQIGRMFKLFRKRYGLDRSMPRYEEGVFRRVAVAGQMALF